MSNKSTHDVRTLTFTVDVDIHDEVGFLMVDRIALALTAAAVDAGAAGAFVACCEAQVRA